MTETLMTSATPVAPAFVPETDTDTATVLAQTAGMAETSEEKNLSDNPFIFVPESREFARVELIYPLEDSDGNEEADRLTIRRPTVDDSVIAEKLAEGDNNATFLARLANLCEVSPEVMETLDELEDMESMAEAYKLLKHYSGEATANPTIVMAEDNKSVRVKLRYPVSLGQDENGQEKRLNELTMRRPRLKDSTEAEKKSQWPTEIAAYKYAALCGVNVEVIKQLDDIDDFAALDAAFSSFRRSKINRRKKR